MTTATLVTVIV